jgi:hypothetical protein
VGRDDVESESLIVEKPVNAPGAEIVLAALEAAVDLGLDGALGEIQAGGDFFLGNQFQAAEDKDFAAAGGKGFDGLGEQDEFFVGGSGVGDTGRCIGDAQALHITYLVVGGTAPVAGEIPGDVAGDLKEEGLRGMDRFGESPESEVGLLNHVIDVVVGVGIAEVTAERRFVGLDLFPEPPLSVGRQGLRQLHRRHAGWRREGRGRELMGRTHGGQGVVRLRTCRPLAGVRPDDLVVVGVGEPRRGRLTEIELSDYGAIVLSGQDLGQP